jgi:hypothetical protein
MFERYEASQFGSDFSRRLLVASASSRQGVPGSSAALSTRAVPNHPGRSRECLPVSW